jgi:hypothetical protein
MVWTFGKAEGKKKVKQIMEMRVEGKMRRERSIK